MVEAQSQAQIGGVHNGDKYVRPDLAVDISQDEITCYLFVGRGDKQTIGAGEVSALSGLPGLWFFHGCIRIVSVCTGVAT
jgi:hypothetical protein